MVGRQAYLPTHGCPLSLSLYLSLSLSIWFSFAYACVALAGSICDKGVTIITIVLITVSREPWQYPARSSDSLSHRGEGIAAVTLSKAANMEPWQYPARKGDSEI